MIAFLVQRLYQAVLVMLTVGLIAFALFNYVGDPINNMVGQDTSLADRERLRQELGLNDTFIVQFARFVGRAARGEFGLSYQQARPVGQIILEKMPATLELSFVAATLALAIGVPMGIYTGLHRNSWLSQDRKSTRLNSSHANISYAVFCLKRKIHTNFAPSAA